MMASPLSVSDGIEPDVVETTPWGMSLLCNNDWALNG